MPLLKVLGKALDGDVHEVRRLVLLLFIRSQVAIGAKFNMDKACKDMRCTKPSVIRHFDKLCIQGLVKRERLEKDQRFIVARLTPEGEAFVQSLEVS